MTASRHFSRLTCAVCGPESLHNLGTCVRCGAVYQPDTPLRDARYVFSIKAGAQHVRSPVDQRRANTKRTGRPPKACPNVSDLRARVARGDSVGQLTAHFEVSAETLRRWFREYDLKLITARKANDVPRVTNIPEPATC